MSVIGECCSLLHSHRLWTPRTPRRACCLDAHVPLTGLRFSRFCEPFPDGFDLHLLLLSRKELCFSKLVTPNRLRKSQRAARFVVRSLRTYSMHLAPISSLLIKVQGQTRPWIAQVLLASKCTHRPWGCLRLRAVLQGYLTFLKTHPPRTLQ